MQDIINHNAMLCAAATARGAACRANGTFTMHVYAKGTTAYALDALPARLTNVGAPWQKAEMCVCGSHHNVLIGKRAIRLHTSVGVTPPTSMYVHCDCGACTTPDEVELCHKQFMEQQAVEVPRVQVMSFDAAKAALRTAGKGYKLVKKDAGFVVILNSEKADTVVNTRLTPSTINYERHSFPSMDHAKQFIGENPGEWNVDLKNKPMIKIWRKSI